MKYIFANWKMYLDYKEAGELAQNLAKADFDTSKVSLAVFPNTINFADSAKTFENTSIDVGAQAVNWTPQGAYTGAVSAHLFAQAGAKYALVGHSERRHIFGETNEDIRKKVEACFDEGLVPVLCVGETKEDLEADRKDYRLKKQISKVFDGLDVSGKEIMVAYEPVWAIGGSGEGKPCTPDDADDVHGWIKEELKQYTKESIPVLYGGSVKAENVLSYVERDVIDGVLVGSASVKFGEFKNLISAAESL